MHKTETKLVSFTRDTAELVVSEEGERERGGKGEREGGEGRLSG